MNSEEQEKPGLEETFHIIEEIIEKMEQSEISLEESFGLYQQGMENIRECSRMLDMVEKKMQILNKEGETKEFAPLQFES